MKLEATAPGLFDRSIVDPPPYKGLVVDGQVFICSTCNRWLMQKRDRPPLSPKNGMAVTETPDIMKDMNDLEKALIAKDILFVRVHKTPKSRWRKQIGKPVFIPIDDNTLLKTMNTVNVPLPRVEQRSNNLS